MSRVRSVSLCSICSARSGEFFEDSKALVLPEVCQAVIENCEDFFFRIRNFFTAVITMEQAMKDYLAKVMQKEDFESQFAILEQFRTVMMKAKICQAVGEYIDNNKTSSSPQAATLCGKLLRIYETPFVAISGAFLNVVQKKISMLESSIEEHLSKQAFASGTPNSSQYWTCLRRRLRLLSELRSNFLDLPSVPVSELPASLIPQSLDGDVKMVLPVEAKTDSAYTSFIGAIGTSGNEASTHMKHMPLNLTMHYP